MQKTPTWQLAARLIAEELTAKSRRMDERQAQRPVSCNVRPHERRREFSSAFLNVLDFIQDAQ
jgi:hypothetical protein